MKNKTTFHFLIICIILLTGCKKSPINGALDGRWQLMNFTMKNGERQECKRIYYSIQLHLVEISHKGSKGYGTFIGRFHYGNNEVKMWDFKRRGNETEPAQPQHLYPFGMNDTINTFKVIKVNNEQMILQSNYAKLIFRKF